MKGVSIRIDSAENRRLYTHALLAVDSGKDDGGLAGLRNEISSDSLLKSRHVDE